MFKEFFDSEQDDSTNNDKKRIRSSEGERNYYCGCGKSYLSYPALYTHVKNKHEGTFPIGSNAKRKLPKNLWQEQENFFVQSLQEFFTEFDDT